METLKIPHSEESEKAVIGSVLYDDSMLARIPDLIPDHFFSSENKSIWRAIKEIEQAGKKVEEITVGEKLEEYGILGECGSYATLLEMSEKAPVTFNIEEWANIIIEHSVMRALINYGSELSRKCRDPQLSVSGALVEAETKLREIIDNKIESPWVHIKDAIETNIKELEQLSANKIETVGLQTGIWAIDRILSGLIPGNLYIIGARPSMGKTALALTMATHIASRTKDAIPFVYREGTAPKVSKRSLAAYGRVNTHFLTTGQTADQEQWDRLARAADVLSSSNMLINDKTKNIDHAVSQIKCLNKRQKVCLTTFDYMQLMEGKPTKVREQEISYISRSLKTLAVDLNIPVIALSQLNRALENRSDRRPQLSDLRESGSIEQDADVIMFIYRDDVYKMKEEKNYTPTNIAEIDIAKHRDGPTGLVELYFEGKHTRFTSIETHVKQRSYTD